MQVDCIVVFYHPPNVRRWRSIDMDTIMPLIPGTRQVYRIEAKTLMVVTGSASEELTESIISRFPGTTWKAFNHPADIRKYLPGLA